MNVKDLIDKLKTLPADALVLVQGYEDGFDAVKAIRQIKVAKKPDAREWNGEYEEAEKNNKNAVSSVVILGNRR